MPCFDISNFPLNKLNSKYRRQQNHRTEYDLKCLPIEIIDLLCTCWILELTLLSLENGLFAGYVLVQFTEDDIYQIVSEDKLKKNSIGLFDAPYGPHHMNYPCRVLRLSNSKSELMKIKAEYENIENFRQEHDVIELENEEGFSSDESEERQNEEVEQKKKEAEMTKKKKEEMEKRKEKEKKRKDEIERKKEEKKKKKEDNEKKKNEEKKEDNEKKKNEEKKKRKEETEKKKEVQKKRKEELEKKKEETNAAKEQLMQRNASLLKEMVQFENDCPAEIDLDDSLDSIISNESCSILNSMSTNNFITDIVDDSSSLISACNQVLIPEPAPICTSTSSARTSHSNGQPNRLHHSTIQTASARRTANNSPTQSIPNPPPRPTVGMKCPRQQLNQQRTREPAKKQPRLSRAEDGCTNCAALQA